MGLAQNGMKAKPALPERVRSMEGLGVSVWNASWLALPDCSCCPDARQRKLCVSVIGGACARRMENRSFFLNRCSGAR